MHEIEITQYRYKLNPPLVAGERLAKVIQASLGEGSVIEMKVDNRYKDGNVQIKEGVLRGNKNTISLKYIYAKSTNKKGGE